MLKNNDEKECVDHIDELSNGKGARIFVKTIIFIFLVVSIVVICKCGYEWFKDIKKTKEQHISNLYYQQNRAFAMDTIDGCYLDQTHIKEVELHVNLLAYKFDNPEATITVEDIKDYLENSKSGGIKKFGVEKKPEIIENYITWYMIPNNNNFIERYAAAISSYYEATTGNKFDDIKENDSDILDKLGEDFFNYPNKEIYLSLSSDQIRNFIDEETLSLYDGFLAGDIKAVFSSVISDERLTFNQNFETGREYSISDIKVLFEEENSEESWICNEEDIDDYMDLGLDGKYVYYVRLNYSKKDAPYHYNLEMLLNKIDGKLHIIFAYGYYFDHRKKDIDDSCSFSDDGKISIKSGDDEESDKYIYFLTSDGKLSYLYTEGTTGAVSGLINYAEYYGLEVSFTLKGSDGSETIVDGRGCELNYFYVDKKEIYVLSLVVANNKGQKYSEDSNEYQTVKKFYEDEGYIFLPDEEVKELRDSIEENVKSNH